MSTTILEISYNLLLDFKNEKVPLIKALDIFIYKNNEDKNPYRINIIMEKGDSELKDMMKGEQIDFFTIFSMFKDLLTGLTRMNLS